MTRLLVPSAVLCAAILTLAGCGDPEDQQRRPSGHASRGGFTGRQPVSAEEQPTTGEPVATVDSSTHEPEHPVTHQEPDSAAPSTAPHTNQSPAVGNYEYGKSVPGKPGFVTSPYAPYQGYVDVRGYAPGTEVKDPYTGKTFLVPAQ